MFFLVIGIIKDYGSPIEHGVKSLVKYLGEESSVKLNSVPPNILFGLEKWNAGAYKCI